ncbi:MFS transporter [Sphingomonas sp. 22176]|uniref:MFS transporter n=1 Tax=Sphingomonas sp. 22176 TaxID=3453884 RepID=UPI003F87B40D
MHSIASTVIGAETRTETEVPLVPGIILAALACLPIAGTLLVAQVLPQMEAAFAGTPDLRARVSIALTIPALVIALCSWGTGWLADRVGRHRLLVAALLLYALFGLLPLVLHSLDAIIASRAAMGVAEGIIMTCSTALTGDLYAGKRRERLLSLQTACASAAAVVFAIIGGLLGNFGWRTPFAVYAVALLVLPLVLVFVPADRPAVRSAGKGRQTGEGHPLAPLAAICAATVVMSLAFYVAQIQTPFLLNALGPVAPSTVGMVSAMTNIAVVAGTACFPVLRRYPLSVTGLSTFMLLAAGLMIAAMATAHASLVAGLILTGFAGGIALPTLLNSVMALLSFAQRGQGAGLWQSSFWAGQFASPILVVVLADLAGSLQTAVALTAAVTLCLGGGMALLLPRRGQDS